MQRRVTTGEAPVSGSGSAVDRRSLLGGRALALTAVGVTAATLALRAAIPPYPIYWAAHDDGLMVSLAASILEGNWTAPWSDVRLSKGPGYPLFLALIHPLGLTPTMGVHLLLIAGATLVSALLAGFGLGGTTALAALVVVSLDPVYFGASGSRVYRDGFLAAMGLQCFAWTALSFWTAIRPGATPRRIAAAAFPAAVAGLLVGWLAVTKADVVLWLAPALAGAALLPVAATGSWQRLVGESAPAATFVVVIVALFAQAVPGVISTLNFAFHGVALTDDFSEGAYQDAWSALTSINAGEPRHRVPVTQSMREAAYGVSPTAAMLKPYLEGPPNTGWRADSCAALDICDESSLWFMWELRAAAASVLGSRRPRAPVAAKDFQAFFSAIATEIDAACSEGRLSCGSGGAVVGLPPLRRIPWNSVPASLWGQFRDNFAVASVDSATIDRNASTGTLLLWTSTVAGVAPEDNPGALVPPAGAASIVVAVLTQAYRWAIWPAAVAALLGIAAGLRRAGPPRAAALASFALATAVGTHMALLGLLQEHIGLVTDLYVIDTRPLLLLSMVLGVAALAGGRGRASL